MQDSNIGDASYYSVAQDADDSKLYVPISWLREVDETQTLLVLEKLFIDKKDVENDIIRPLKNKKTLVKKHSMPKDNVEALIDESNYVDEALMHHNIDYLFVYFLLYKFVCINICNRIETYMGESINLFNNFKVSKVIFNCRVYNVLEYDLIKVQGKRNIKYYSCIK